ncbi:hypothetical protein IWZ03DRAFT_126321 [Phyllosticta citriasiana]|uniref:Uncharacterized protein n=1 Tax=Phyllosticta citriasiana TaxID=595635 RepID=A0ABR1KQZ0_9PEZI
MILAARPRATSPRPHGFGAAASFYERRLLDPLEALTSCTFGRFLAVADMPWPSQNQLMRIASLSSRQVQLSLLPPTLTASFFTSDLVCPPPSQSASEYSVMGAESQRTSYSCLQIEIPALPRQVRDGTIRSRSLHGIKRLSSCNTQRKTSGKVVPPKRLIERFEKKRRVKIDLPRSLNSPSLSRSHSQKQCTGQEKCTGFHI